MIRRLYWCALALLVATWIAVLQSQAATFYVDPDDGTCSDASASPTSTDPWCTPPGTRNAANNATLNSNTVDCGDTILLRGGATQNSGEGGRWILSTANYADCGGSADDPTTIRIATSGEWGTSSGDFTIDGTSVTLGGNALVGMSGDKVHLRGLSASSRTIIQDSADIGLEATGQRLWVRWYRVTNSAGFGLPVISDDSLFQDGEIDNNLGIGVVPGYQADNDNTRNTFYNLEIHDNGPANPATQCSSQGGGIHTTGDGRRWFINVRSYSNQCEAYQQGVIGDAEPPPNGIQADQFNNYRNIAAFSQFGANNQTGQGFAISGDQNGTTPANNPAYSFGDTFETIATVNGFISWGTSDTCQGTGHGGGVTHIWHLSCVTYGGYGITYDEAAEWIGIHNSLSFDASNEGGWSLGNIDSSGGAYQVTRELRVTHTSLYATDSGNVIALEDFVCSGQPTVGCQKDEDCGGTCGIANLGTQFTWASPPNFLADTASVTRSSAGYAGFVTFGAGCSGGTPYNVAEYDACDFDLQASATNEINQGTCAYVTTNSGSSSTGPINVEHFDADDAANFGGYGLNDPRRFFFLTDAQGDNTAADVYAPVGSDIGLDQVQVGSTVASITNITSTSLTVASPITWSSGACVHTPFLGSAPDRGAREFTTVTPVPRIPWRRRDLLLQALYRLAS